MGKLAGKVAAITGGASGIGLATAEEFQVEGARVAILGRSQSSLDEARSGLGARVYYGLGDVSRLDDLGQFFSGVVAALGKIDVLFVNAGITKVGPIDNLTEADFDEVMTINFKGAYFTIQKALPHMNDGASIVLNTSINAEIGMPNTTVYAASKAALSSLIRTASADLLARRIRVNAVSPGPTVTPLFGKIGLPQAQLDQFAQYVQSQVPVGRFGQSAEIAKAVTFLASDDSAFILGTELVVDGGMSQL